MAENERLPGLLSRASQVRILPGAPRNSRLWRATTTQPDRFAPIHGVRFHCTKAPRGIVARILLMPMGPKMPPRPWRIDHRCKTDSRADRDCGHAIAEFIRAAC